MNISIELQKLGIAHQCVGTGNFNFDTLGLIQSNTEKSICTFIDNEKFIKDIPDHVSVILTKEELKEALQNYNCCIVESPRITFFQLHNSLCGSQMYIRETTKTKIGDNCKISNLACIADKNVKIGNNVTIEEFVSIKENVTIGDNCIIRAGTIVGGEGFEHKRMGEEILPVKHMGGVILGDNVELQQINCVDKAIYPWDNTEIGEDCKTDNMVHIAHGVKIGRAVMIAANAVFGGRIEMGDEVWVGLAATIKNGIHIGSRARINMGAVVTKNVEAEESVSGNFAIPHSQFIKHIKNISRGGGVL